MSMQMFCVRCSSAFKQRILKIYFGRVRLNQAFTSRRPPRPDEGGHGGHGFLKNLGDLLGLLGVLLDDGQCHVLSG
jgi:hypothetical protein